MSGSARRLFQVAAALACMAMLANCSGGSSSDGGQSSTSSAATLLAQAVAAIRAQTGVHATVHATIGPNSAVYSNDAGVAVGRQQVKAGDGGEATILEVNGVGYFQAQAKGLVGFLGVSEQVAGRYAGQWVSFHAGDLGYQRVVSGVTIGALADELELTGRVTMVGRTTMNGQSVVALRGGIPPVLNAPAGLQATLYVTDDSRHLPVMEKGGVGNSVASLEFSNWGESVQVNAPSPSVPSTTVLSGQQYSSSS